jgi:CO/xanthine dehydrogenase Mo-binding subunit
MEEQEVMLDNAFKTRVQSVLRTTDCGFLMPDGRVQVLLPETSQTGAKSLQGKVLALPLEVFDEEIRTAVNPKATCVMFYNSDATRMDYSMFSASLEEAFNRTTKGAALQPQKTQAA